MNTLSETIDNIEKQDMPPISNDTVDAIITSIKEHDSDLVPLLDIIAKLIKNIKCDKDKTFFISKILKFYGISNNDILSTRHKFIIESGKLVKVPLLKKSQKECISILLQQLDIRIR